MRKDKRIISVLFVGIIVYSIYSFTAKNQILTLNEEKNVQENDEVTEELSMTQKSDEMPEEFYSFEGKWIVGEFIDGAEESIDVDTESEEYKEGHARYIAKYIEKYEGYTFEITTDSIEHFGSWDAKGYYYDDYRVLYYNFRQPSTLEIAPPFLCAWVQLKGLDEWFYIIIDGNGKAVFEARNLFFELDRVEGNTKLGDIKTVISPDRMSCVIALDDNGNVWKWREGRTKEDAVAITGLEDVVQIVDTGYNSVYALTSEGDVYAWGFNRGFLIDPKERETSVEFPEPVKLQGLSNITKIDAANGRAFAVNDDGQLFVWGLGRYKGSREDYIPSLLEGYQELTDHVEEIYVGAGNFHYFKCEDNQIFSIISVEYISEDLKYFIIPNFQGELSAFDWQNEIWTGNSERIFDIQEEGGFYLVYLYKMGENDNVALMGADAYTMYVYQNDGTLWYWNSDRITYHDCEWMGASVELRDLDYSGFLKRWILEVCWRWKLIARKFRRLSLSVRAKRVRCFYWKTGRCL